MVASEKTNRAEGVTSWGESIMRTMKMKAECERAGSWLKALQIAAGAAAMLGYGASALAELNDQPYFNLWSTDSSYGAYTGNGTAVWMCGSDECSPGTAPSVSYDANGNPVLAGGGSGYALFSIVNTQPAGSGYIDPFLRFQHNEPPGTGGSNPTETAYSTSNDVLQNGQNGYVNQAKDTVAGGTPRDSFNHAVLFSSLGVEEVNGQKYMTFLLDINEPGKNCHEKDTSKCTPTSTLRLDELEFFIATTDQLSRYLPSNLASDPQGIYGGDFNDAVITSGQEKVARFWDMDYDLVKDKSSPNNKYPSGTRDCATTGSSCDGKGYGGLLLDNINDGLGGAGSGDYDVQVKIPYTLELQKFLRENSNDSSLYVYLYNTAGEADQGCDSGNKSVDCGEAAAGFEEWAAVMNSDGGGRPGGVPIPPTAMLFAAGMVAMVRRKKR